MDENVPFITIHDGILLPDHETGSFYLDSYDFYSKSLELNLMSQDLFNLPIPVKEESL